MLDHAITEMEKGADLACQQFSGINDNGVINHFHDYYEIFYLQSGRRIVIVNDREYELHPGQFVMVPPNIMHYVRGCENVAFTSLLCYFSPQAVYPQLYDSALSLKGVFSIRQAEVSPRFDRMMSDLVDESCGDGSFHREAARSILNVVLVNVLRSAGETPAVSERGARIKEILRYIEENYMRPDLSLDSLSAKFFISRFHLSREFKKYTNFSITDTVNSVRVINAKRLFAQSDYSLTRISAEVGFSSLSYFERVYLKITGQKPKADLKKYRERRGR